MDTVNTVVAAVSRREVKTKFGLKDSVSFKGSDDVWYSYGFQKNPPNKGDEVTFVSEDTKYGKDVMKGTLVVTSSSPVGPSPVGVTPSRPAAASGRPFPIPPLHGDRAIVRQNSLGHAINIVSMEHVGIDAYAKEVIRVARLFEAYSCGDTEREAHEKANGIKS